MGHKMINEYTEKIVNVETGEETFRTYTSEEIAAVEAAKVEIQNKIALEETQELTKQTAQDKLTALGLTVDDLKALLS
jgi:hypothetical protein